LRGDTAPDPGPSAANVLVPWDRENLRDFVRGGDFEAFTAAYEGSALCGSDDEVSARIEQYVAAGADQVNFSRLPQWGIEGIVRLAQLLDLTPRAHA
jgi:alkanesulfonate monooxygenase SsuD/methylene tetrahydromethanopterin reductase-like flavin-dependent oxidoreductase (luciferase family)